MLSLYSSCSQRQFAAIVVVVVVFVYFFAAVVFDHFFTVWGCCRIGVAPSLQRSYRAHTPFPSHFTLKVFFKRKSEQKCRNDLFLFERVDFARFRPNQSVRARRDVFEILTLSLSVPGYHYYSWISRKVWVRKKHLVQALSTSKITTDEDKDLLQSKLHIEHNTHERTTTRATTIDKDFFFGSIEKWLCKHLCVDDDDGQAKSDGKWLQTNRLSEYSVVRINNNEPFLVSWRQIN